MNDAISDYFNAKASEIRTMLRISASPSVSIGVFHMGEHIASQHIAQEELLVGDHGGNDNGSTRNDTPNDETLYSGSCLSSLLSVCLVLRYVHDGVLNLDTPIREYLWAYRQRNDEIGRRMTLRDLASHHTGYLEDKVWWAHMTGANTLSKPEMLQVAVSLPTVSGFRMNHTYSRWNVFLLQTVVETVTGRDFGDLVNQFFTAPLGINSKKPSPFDKPNVAPGHFALGNSRVAPVTEGKTRQVAPYVYEVKNASLQHSIRTLSTFLAAYCRQKTSSVTITPGNPFVRLRTLFESIEKPRDTDLASRAFALGKTDPASQRLGLQVSSLLSHNVIHRTECVEGCSASFYLIPDIQSGVVCLSNSSSMVALSLVDLTSVIGRQLVGILLKQHVEEEVIASSQEQRSFRFLSLPPEIRNMVYMEVLKTSSGNVRLIQNGDGYLFAEETIPRPKIIKPMNCIKNTSQQLMRESRGLELIANSLVADGGEFDRFLVSNVSKR